MSLLDIIETPFQGLYVVQRKPVADKRGFFERMYCSGEFSSILKKKRVKQVNHTHTAIKGTVRGFHYQYPPHAETKIISCLHGEVFDVAVDLRKNSPTFLKYFTQVLSAKNVTSMIVPEGFAHGFQSLCDDCEMLYFHTAAYSKQAESGLNPRDRTINVEWPIKISQISDRDNAHASVDINFKGVEIT